MSAASARTFIDPDWALAALSAGAAIAAWTLLWMGGGEARTPSEAPSIALLESSIQDVRRRPGGTLVWDDIDPGAALAWGDAVFVPPGSGATVVFTDGTRLELDENTFVALEPPAEGRTTPQIRVDTGVVLGSAGASALEVQSKSGVTRIEKGSKARVSLEGATAARVEVLEGQASLQDGSRMGANESAVVRDGTWKRTVFTVQLVEPAPLFRQYFAGETPQPLELKWTGAVPEGARVRITARGGAMVFEEDAGPQSASFQPTKAGVYDWRIVGADGAPLSEPRRFVLVRDVPPTLTSPRADEVVHGYLGHRVPFSWSPVQGVAGYAIEVADGPDFSRIVFREEPGITQRRVAWAHGEGRYYWRVRSNAPDERGLSPWSDPGVFRYLTKPLPDAPELIDSALEVDP